MSLRAVKGMKDILPDEISKWHRLENAFRRRVEGYGFREARFPIVEPTPLFVRSIGETTDIVEKEMYTFTDRGDKSLTLRPEGTASAVRAYVQHSVQAREPVSKWVQVETWRNSRRQSLVGYQAPSNIEPAAVQGDAGLLLSPAEQLALPPGVDAHLV